MRVVAIVVALVSAACGEPVTLAVDLRSDFVGGVEVHRAVTRIDGTVVGEAALGAEDDLATGVRIADARTTSGTRRLEVVLADAGGAELARREMIVQAISDRAVTFVITRSCRDVTCPPSDDPALTTCVGGRCAAPECGPENPEACPAPECVSDATCPSGGACSTPACVDGVCLQVGDDASCHPQRFCAGSIGCVDRPERTRCAWPADPDALRFGTPEPVGDDPRDLTSWLSHDHLALYVSRHLSQPDLFVYRRADPQAPFGPAEPLDEVNTDTEERRIEISPDGRFAVLSGELGLTPDVDVFFGTRPTPSDPWSWERSDALSADGVNDLGVHLARSGLEVWYHRSDEVLLSRRQSPSEPFGPPEVVTEPFIPEDGSLSLTDDGLVVVFHARRSGGGDLYYAVRADPDDAFGTPMPVAPLNDPIEQDWVPYVRGDGCELFFARGPYLDGQLYRVSVLP